GRAGPGHLLAGSGPGADARPRALCPGGGRFAAAPARAVAAGVRLDGPAGSSGPAAAGASPTRHPGTAAGPAGSPTGGGPVMPAQRGLALIGVLWVMATAVALLTWTLSRHWLAIQRSATLLESRQAHYYALAGESHARQQLAADRLQNRVDHRGES